MDTSKRSWLKSVTWRIVGILVLGLITFVVTGNWKETTLITILFNVIQIIMYYTHERIWEKIKWGRKEHPLADFEIKKEISREDMQIIRDKLKSLGYVD